MEQEKKGNKVYLKPASRGVYKWEKIRIYRIINNYKIQYLW